MAQLLSRWITKNNPKVEPPVCHSSPFDCKSDDPSDHSTDQSLLSLCGYLDRRESSEFAGRPRNNSHVSRTTSKRGGVERVSFEPRNPMPRRYHRAYDLVMRVKQLGVAAQASHERSIRPSLLTVQEIRFDVCVCVCVLRQVKLGKSGGRGR